MRVIVCGSRDHNCFDTVSDALDAIHAVTPIDWLIEGGANGVDAHSSDWAWLNDIRSSRINADWRRHGKAAGPIRNSEMLRMGVDAVIAIVTGAGPGTRNMIAQAKAAGVRVIEAEAAWKEND